MSDFNWQSWLIEDSHELIEKKVARGIASLSDCERLFYCLWVADYGMGNAGDLEVAKQLYPKFHIEGLQFARVLGLPNATLLFSKSQIDFEESYYSLLDDVCSEINSRLIVQNQAC